ncbi:SUKH-3 domain-containing protein [Flavobacterium sp. NRK F7]|uniref:SUKH-3 domain-containing protein n=1 Tax=Flavobacterium sp. NRK F7 TaxID=2954930 RepID=UPI002090DEB2|nr:SUKH-3 domain-containing protein [Flavobacterium sp. NRK F7]MCO6161664.1 SUKH-3 domain-containing protein [Flavobacterium sp. NRK F7]
MSFTKEMENHLKTMGWDPNRKITTYDEFMERYNYPEFIREFIRTYGGLKILELLEKEDSNVVNRTSLNPLDSDGMGANSVAEDWATDLGRKLYVIGLYSPENFDIAVDANGAVYFLGQDCYCLGKNIFKGLESIIRIDQWSSIQLDAKDPTSGLWYISKDKAVDFDTYEFKYRTF